MGDASCSIDRGFESQHCILDGHDMFHIDLLKKFYCLFENTENKKMKKRPGLAHCIKRAYLDIGRKIKLNVS